MTDKKGRAFTLIALALAFTPYADASELSWVGCELSKTSYISDLAQAYQQKTGTQISLSTSDANSGIRDVRSGQADIGSSTRFRLADDPRESGVELVPVAWDAVTIIVHKDNPVNDISLEHLRKVFTRRITSWSALGGTDQKIEVLIHQDDNSENGSSLREALFSDTTTRFRASRRFGPDNSLEQFLMENPNAIAITGINRARSLDVKIVAVDGVIPSVENLKSGSYGLYRPLYLTYNPNSDSLESIKNFINYINSKNGRDLIRRNGVVPYREAISLVMKKVRDNEASYPQSVDKI